MSGARVGRQREQDETMEDDDRPPELEAGVSPVWVEKVQKGNGGGDTSAGVGRNCEHDETMEEDGRPLELEAGASRVWVEKVQKRNGGGVPVPEKVLADDFVRSRMSLEFPNGEGGEPVITIGREVLEAMNGLYKQCMVVKVLGRHLTVAAMNRKLQDLWRPSGGMSVLDLPKQFFIIRFDLEEDYMKALTGGPWRVYGSIMMVQAWSPDFDPLTDEIATTPVWVRIANIPINFYHCAILMGIAEGLGSPIKVDLTTMRVERARFARVCVEVNLKKPLKGSIVVNGERYYVAYEGLSKSKRSDTLVTRVLVINN